MDCHGDSRPLRYKKKTGELLPAQGEAKVTEERVLALHTEMCEKEWSHFHGGRT